MTDRLPTRLETEPLLEVVAEMRFESSDASAVNLLPGILSERFSQYDEVKTLPNAQIPASLASKQEALKYLPHIQLRHDNNVIAIGPHSITVAQLPPYAGWTKFSAHALEVFEELKGRKFVGSVERISLRYADIIDLGTAARTDWLNTRVEVAGVESHDVVQLKVENGTESVRIVTQIVSPAYAQDGRNGVVVDVDTINLAPTRQSFWDELRANFEQLHDLNKTHFFSLLKPSTLEQLKPHYDATDD